MMLDKTLLSANILIVIIGPSMFMVFQTIPILVRSPIPFGFGESATNTGNVQLPFALVLLVFGPGLNNIKIGMKPITIKGLRHTDPYFVCINQSRWTDHYDIDVLQISSPEFFPQLFLA